MLPSAQVSELLVPTCYVSNNVPVTFHEKGLVSLKNSKNSHILEWGNFIAVVKGRVNVVPRSTYDTNGQSVTELTLDCLR